MNRNKHSIPVAVCEFHQEVLEFIHRYIATKRLPYENLKMVHFDSHPDLAFPHRLCAEDCYSKEKMYNDLDIADWILPLVYAGHLRCLTWVKPPWAKQIEETVVDVNVGEEHINGKLRIDCTEDYFLEDCTYAPTTLLRHIKPIALAVIELNALVTRCRGIEKQSNESYDELTDQNNSYVADVKRRKLSDTSETKSACLEKITSKNYVTGQRDTVETAETKQSFVEKHKLRGEKETKQSFVEKHKLRGEKETKQDIITLLPTSSDRYILDIDLDFFSVTNPFLQDYTKEEYQQLKSIYKYEFPADKSDSNALTKCVSEAQKKFESLEATIKSFSESNCTETDENKMLVKFLKKIQERKGPDIDWELVHNAGMTTDLPHHLSTDDEINCLVEDMVSLLKCLPPPALITVARSAVDEYCPSSQVDNIQKKVIDALSSLYANIELNLDYKDETRLY